MKRNVAKRRWLRRINLYKKQSGRCWHCNNFMVLYRLRQYEQPPEDYATFEHLQTRRSHGQRGNVVLACLKCNQEKNDEESAWLNYQAKMTG